MGTSRRGLGTSKSEDEREGSDDDFSDSDDVSSFSGSDSEPDSMDEEADETKTEQNAEKEPEDEEDEVVKAIKAEKERKPDHPPDINLEDFIVDISFHPARDIIALASITGDILLYEYNNEVTNLLETHELHLRACRGVEFNAEGSYMFSTAKDRTIMVTDMSTGKLKQCYEDCHEVPVYCLKPLDENKIATGDDNGVVKLWDLRKQEPIYTVSIGDEYVADMITNDAAKYLACAGGDGVLTALDVKNNKIYASSEDYDAELTCMGLFRNDHKLLVGSAKGRMYLFNWQEFGLHSDEYVGEKQSVSCMIPITQNIVVTSGEDGILRAAHLFPHRQLGVVGQHVMPVEKLDISHDGQFIASCSHNQDIKFWSISYFESLEKIIDVNQKQNKKKDMSNNLPSSKLKNASDFFSGMV